VLTSLEATEDLDGASIEVLDLRSLYPYDREAVLASVRKTSKVVLVQEATRSCGVAAEIAALIAEEAFEDLDGPVVRVTAPDVPIPFSPPLERAALPQVEDVRNACRELLAY
jgi:pyruvate/2-oxoglutarate/acetoin dehydrogenase E1 component